MSKLDTLRSRLIEVNTEIQQHKEALTKLTEEQGCLCDKITEIQSKQLTNVRKRNTKELIDKLKGAVYFDKSIKGNDYIEKNRELKKCIDFIEKHLIALTNK